MKKTKIIILCITVVVVALTVITIGRTVPQFRPMLYYEGSLYWDEEAVDILPSEKTEYVGIVDSIIPNYKIPDENFECNNKVFENAKIYKDKNGCFYIELENGTFLKLKHN